ncbi:hypothetical protein EYF80_046556 [Liparis tanakae]|uniref:Uncharacterized protein n=1 Tax=Liparis tanakae TaxID=230148 RepID=A0A4Z2FQT6_9TELE|nr:hypothetical protein EYF80_046556 [Liparis tanakae]
MGAKIPGMVPNVLVIPRRSPAYLQQRGGRALRSGTPEAVVPPMVLERVRKVTVRMWLQPAYTTATRKAAEDNRPAEKTWMGKEEKPAHVEKPSLVLLVLFLSAVNRHCE